MSFKPGDVIKGIDCKMILRIDAVTHEHYTYTILQAIEGSNPAGFNFAYGSKSYIDRSYRPITPLEELL